MIEHKGETLRVQGPSTQGVAGSQGQAGARSHRGCASIRQTQEDKDSGTARASETQPMWTGHLWREESLGGGTVCQIHRSPPALRGFLLVCILNQAFKRQLRSSKVNHPSEMEGEENEERF